MTQPNPWKEIRITQGKTLIVDVNDYGNLRVVTPRQNALNRRPKINKTGFRGVRKTLRAEDITQTYEWQDEWYISVITRLRKMQQSHMTWPHW